MSIIEHASQYRTIPFGLYTLLLLFGVYLYQRRWLTQPVCGLKLRKIVAVMLIIIAIAGLIKNGIMIHTP